MEKDLKELITVYDGFNIGAVRGILEDSNIEYFSHSANGIDCLNIIEGFNLTGVTYYVHEKDFEKAKELLMVIFGDNIHGK